MQKQLIEIAGMDAEQVQERANCLQQIEALLDTDELKKLTQIAKSKTARSYLNSRAKFQMLKKFLKL